MFMAVEAAAFRPQTQIWLPRIKHLTLLFHFLIGKANADSATTDFQIRFEDVRAA